MPSASPPVMKLFFPLAGLCVFALAAIPAAAQHGGGSGGGHAGGGGGGSHSYGMAGGSHAGSGDGVHSYSGGSAGRASGGAGYSMASTGRAGGFSGARASSGSYSYPGTGIRDTSAGGRAGYSEITNHGGIRISDFGAEEAPRFSARMLAPAPETASHRSYQEIASAAKSDKQRREWMSHGQFDPRDRDFYRFRHSGLVFFGTVFCDPFGWAAYDQTFLAANTFGCFGQSYIGLAYGSTAEWLGENVVPPDAVGDQPADFEYSPDDEAATVTADETSAPDAAQQVTLLQLKDGSMYGLTAYWVEGGELHYVTNYGGANAITLDRIDLAKTVQLNASHGQAFVLQEKPASNDSVH